MEKSKRCKIDHIDIVTSHICNKRCKHCVDKFIHSSSKIVSLNDIEKFLKLVRCHTNEPLEVLLLGGEPTVLPKQTLIDITRLIKEYDFAAIMSTNGILKQKIIELIPFFDSIQVTVNSDTEIDLYRKWPDKINIKLAGDNTLTKKKLDHFISYTEGFERRSVSMYFTTDHVELCTDVEVWNLLNQLQWKRNGSYFYTFYKGVRFKRCIPGETNIIDEPAVPKLYPNGNYNKSWDNEYLDDYLSFGNYKWN